jgi:murein L,D-transpeptidase YafK
LVLGNKLLETDLLVKQARTFLTEGQFDRSLRMSDLASKLLLAQTTVLTTELGRYSDEARIEAWKIMAKRTVDWTKTTGAPGIVISKAERTLTLYKHGRKVLAYPVRLGYNGIREKRYQGDGATPEGEYRVLRKRGAGQTQFYRALVLNYPNASDRRRFREARKAGYIPGERGIGGQIEIHGVEYELMAQTLGCVMLDNRQMAKLFDLVEVGTPVTIVGALHSNNAVALALTNLSEQEEET